MENKHEQMYTHNTHKRNLVEINLIDQLVDYFLSDKDDARTEASWETNEEPRWSIFGVWNSFESVEMEVVRNQDWKCMEKMWIVYSDRSLNILANVS